MTMLRNHSNGGNDLITLCEANYLVIKVVRMAGIVKIRSAFNSPYDILSYILICQPKENIVNTIPNQMGMVSIIQN